LRHLRASLGLSVTAVGPRGAALAVVRLFELMIPRGLAKQRLEVRWRVVRGRRVESHDTRLVVTLISWLQLQACDAIRVHGDEMETTRGHLQREALHGTAVAAGE